MKVWFDTEFIEDGVTIDLISIGLIREDGATYYAEADECDFSAASDWVRENVFPKLTGKRTPRAKIAQDIVYFAGDKPEFWAYYADYDWVALCQLFGTMMDLPRGWPMYCCDVKQACDAVGNPKLPEQTGEHHALADAVWTKRAWEFLEEKALPQNPRFLGPLAEHQVFRTLNKLPIHWRGRKFTHACEGSDVHPGVRLLWTRCQIDVPANAAYLPSPPEEDAVTCHRCVAADAAAESKLASSERPEGTPNSGDI